MDNNTSINTELKKQSLLEHIYDFRKLLIICLLSILLGFIIIFIGFSDIILNYLIKPIENRNLDVIYLAITEAFSIKIKISFIAGFILVSPIVIFQIWLFIKPALYKKERIKFFILYISAIALFALGITFSYIAVFNLAINFFIISSDSIATPMISIEKYINFLFNFLIPFGLIFQLPIVIILLTKYNIVCVESLIKYRKYIIFSAFFVAAIITPPDFISQIMLGFPIIILYEVGILISKLLIKK